MIILSRTTTISSLVKIAIAMVAVAALSGCAKTSLVEASGKGTIRGINSMLTSPELIFKIEERPLGNIAFKGVAGFEEYDNLTYNFNFDMPLPGIAVPVRLATQSTAVMADTEYTIVLTGTTANPAIVSWEAPEREWLGTETVFEADFVHLSPSFGELDFYFATAGTVPVVGNAVGTLSFGERIPYVEFSASSLELIITPKDDVDPANYIFQSQPIASTLATRVTFTTFEPDPSITASIGVNLINTNGGSSSLADVNSPARFRLFHAAFGTDRVDGFLNSDFGNVIFSDIGFGEISQFVDVESIVQPFTVTDSGNAGAPVHEANILIAPNSRRTLILVGSPTELLFREIANDARSVEPFPVVRFTNLSVNADFVTLYMLDPGTVITTETAPVFSGLPSLVDTGFAAPDAGLREITVTLFGEITPVSAPLTLDIANGDIVDIAILDTVDPAVLELVVWDSTLP